MVLRVDARAVGVRRPRILAVGIAQHHEPVEVLERPAVFDQLDGQPVEQFGVGRGFAVGAEVVGRGDDSAAEVVLPEPVDDDAGRQRLVGPGEPAWPGRGG